MTYVMRDYHGHRQELDGPAEAVRQFDEQADAIMSHGGSGQVIWFAPAGGSDALRIDVDVDTGRAALRWLADGSQAVELDPDMPLRVLESTDGGLVTIPAELARVSVATARQAVAEYVTTGQRPTCVEWTTG